MFWAHHEIVQESEFSFLLPGAVQQVEQLRLGRVVLSLRPYLVLEEELLREYADEGRELDVEFLVEDAQLSG